jgi:ABC-type amino acid transport substrate-binding protein
MTIIMNPHLKKILSALILLALIAGCAGEGEKNKKSNPQAGADTIREEIVQKISDRVIGGIPVTGRLQEIKKRGILRVALPPKEPPFQSLDPTLKLPIGFNPALVAEIALILEVKPNITILGGTSGAGSLPAGWSTKYDLVFLTEYDSDCPAKQKIPYFYNIARPHWKSICVADTDGGFTSAVNETLTYLNETGIFAQLYQTHVAK